MSLRSNGTIIVVYLRHLYQWWETTGGVLCLRVRVVNIDNQHVICILMRDVSCSTKDIIDCSKQHMAVYSSTFLYVKCQFLTKKLTSLHFILSLSLEYSINRIQLFLPDRIHT